MKKRGIMEKNLYCKLFVYRNQEYTRESGK